MKTYDFRAFMNGELVPKTKRHKFRDPSWLLSSHIPVIPLVFMVILQPAAAHLPLMGIPPMV